MSKLSNALDASQKELNEGAALRIDDLQSQAEPFLTEKTKTAMLQKYNGLDILRADSEGRGYVYARCLYIGKRTPLSKLEDGIKFVAEKINALGEAGKIVSILSHFIKFDLYQSDIAVEQDTIVICYVHVDLETYNLAMADTKTSGAFQEGGIPE